MPPLSGAGWSSLVARRAHNPKVVGSNPTPATIGPYGPVLRAGEVGPRVTHGPGWQRSGPFFCRGPQPVKPLGMTTSELVATWLTAVGTVGAVVVALFSDVFRHSLNKPILELRLRETLGNITDSVLIPPEGDPHEPRNEWARFYHVLVVNKRARTPATQVQVYLTQLDEFSDGNVRTTWRGDTPIRWRYQEHRPAQQTIGEGHVDADLCHVTREKWIEIHPLIEPVGLKKRWRVAEAPIAIIVTLQARGTEAVSAVTRFRIDWDGHWAQDDAAMARHLTVKTLKS